MSKQKNVHPDHYKTGGSGHQGEGVVQSDHREKLAQEKAERRRSNKNDSKPQNEKESADES